MPFSIDLTGVAGLPPLLDRASAATLSAAQYPGPHTRLDFSSSWVASFVNGHEEFVSLVRQTVKQFSGETAQGGAHAVRAAIRFYRHTDLSRAAIMDEGFPRTEHVDVALDAYTINTTPSPVAFQDVADPYRWFTEPGDHLDDRAGFTWSVLDALSPVRIACGAVWEVTSLATMIGLLDRPVDLLEEVVRPLAGDWPGLRRCAEVWRNLAHACWDVDTNIRSNVEAVPPVWTGNAAEACELFLIRAGDCLALLATEVNKAADSYEHTADEVYAFSQELAGVLSVVGDLALMALVELSAAVATVETGIGPLAFGGLAAYDIYAIGRAVVKAYHIVELIMSSGETLGSLIGTSIDGINGRVLPAVPQLPTLVEAPVLPGR